MEQSIQILMEEFKNASTTLSRKQVLAATIGILIIAGVQKDLFSATARNRMNLILDEIESAVLK